MRKLLVVGLGLLAVQVISFASVLPFDSLFMPSLALTGPSAGRYVLVKGTGVTNPATFNSITITPYTGGIGRASANSCNGSAAGAFTFSAAVAGGNSIELSFPENGGTEQTLSFNGSSAFALLAFQLGGSANAAGVNCILLTAAAGHNGAPGNNEGAVSATGLTDAYAENCEEGPSTCTSSDSFDVTLST